MPAVLTPSGWTIPAAAQREEGGLALIASPTERTALLSIALIRDLTTTRQQVALPSGALWVSVQYRLLPGATAVANQFARIVVNAASDADANGRLALDGAFIALCQGDELLIAGQDDDPITRIDVVSSAAVGSEKTLLQVLAGVRQ